MKKFEFFAFLLFFFLPFILFGEEKEKTVIKVETKKELVEKSGTIQAEIATPWFRQLMRDRILVLKTPDESFSLLRGVDKRVVAKLEILIGKEVTIRGELVPASKRHPRRAIKVISFSEVAPDAKNDEKKGDD